MSKVNDFCLIGSLGLLIAGSTDKVLRVFAIRVRMEADETGDAGDVLLELKGKIIKESESRTLQVTFDSKRSIMLVLSSDNKLEIFKVIGAQKTDSILKKLIKREKKAALKRTHSEASDDSLPIKKSIDKTKLNQLIENRTYDMTLHFTRKQTVPLAEPTGSKAKSFVVGRDDKDISLIVSYHSNTCNQYLINLKP